MYGLDGAVVSTSDVGRVNNVDLRDGVNVGGEEEIVVAATNRTTETIDVLALDPESGELSPLVDVALDEAHVGRLAVWVRLAAADGNEQAVFALRVGDVPPLERRGFQGTDNIRVEIHA